MKLRKILIVALGTPILLVPSPAQANQAHFGLDNPLTSANPDVRVDWDGPAHQMCITQNANNGRALVSVTKPSGDVLTYVVDTANCRIINFSDGASSRVYLEAQNTRFPNSPVSTVFNISNS